jgi:hypothetical protein
MRPILLHYHRQPCAFRLLRIFFKTKFLARNERQISPAICALHGTGSSVPATIESVARARHLHIGRLGLWADLRNGHLWFVDIVFQVRSVGRLSFRFNYNSFSFHFDWPPSLCDHFRPPECFIQRTGRLVHYSNEMTRGRRIKRKLLITADVVFVLTKEEPSTN